VVSLYGAWWVGCEKRELSAVAPKYRFGDIGPKKVSKFNVNKLEMSMHFAVCVAT